MYTKFDIAKIIAERDEIPLSEAKDLVNDVQEMINEAIESGEFIEVENIMYDELGLELDYINALV